MLDDRVPHLQAEMPHRCPSEVGREESAYKADITPDAPLAPPKREDTYTLRSEEDPSVIGDLDLSMRETPLRDSPRRGGASGAPREEESSDAANSRPTQVGHRWGKWGTPEPETLAPGWFCPLWFRWPRFEPPVVAPPAGRELPARIANWPEDARDNWEERSGIMEYLGGLPRDDAERQAEIRVRLEYARSLATPSGSSPESVFAEAAPLSLASRPGEARTGGPEREPGDPEGEWAPSGS